ncbi:hypothetical protein QQG74_09365 [Micromonospora sp. FIMYZ51]|uniref:hypothetical protein n=1 Tax=Micromonospora sp. FIMYZ51 TaxID=3051832 RepID=UPI00311F48CB
MCGCEGNIPCSYHADQIMNGLADARDLAEQGNNFAAEQTMTRLRLAHGEGRVRLVMDEVCDGLLDLSTYGNPYPRRVDHG